MDEGIELGKADETVMDGDEPEVAPTTLAKEQKVPVVENSLKQLLSVLIFSIRLTLG